MAALPPLQHEVKVDLDPPQAFELFTSRIGEWWPLASLSSTGLKQLSAFTDDGRLLERHGEQASSWGEVTEWVPGERLAMTWHPGRDEDEASQLTVTFSAYGEQTLVTLEHAGWEVYEDAVAARTNYSGGWATVMGSYAEAGPNPAMPSPRRTTWAALLFTPAAGQGAAVFEDERFAGHIAFLNQMEAGRLSRGRRPDARSRRHGMTVLRLPGEGRLDEIERLAQEDASVSSGLFDVTVRPWRVFFAPGVPSAVSR